MSRELFERYSEYEDELRSEFHRHPIYRTFQDLTREQFVAYLLQIGFIADNFIRWYQTAMHGFESERARAVIRNILRDEIPRLTEEEKSRGLSDPPTHQDERRFDLEMMGATRNQIVNTRASSVTTRTVESLRRLVRFPQSHYDLRVLVTLRMAGEVLVAEQYRHIVRYMKTRLGIDPKSSRFYVPHYVHDLKGREAKEGGHTDAFDDLLAEMITNEEELAVAMDAARLAYETRSGINDQFLLSHEIRGSAKKAMAVAVAAALVLACALTVRDVRREHDRTSWQQFVSSLQEGRAFYAACDAYLLKRFVVTGSSADLAKVGTENACREAWGGVEG